MDRELLGAVMAIWAFAGMIVVIELPTPKTKTGALLLTLAGGPFAWCIAIGLGLLKVIDRCLKTAR